MNSLIKIRCKEVLNLECCLITNGRCLYEINDNCTSICGGERPFGKPLCEVESLEHKEDITITKRGLEQFLSEFSNAIKNR